MYRWFQEVGLSQRKKLTLGGIDAPDECVLPCVRGLLDGDGSIVTYVYEGGGKAAGRTYEGLVTRFLSASNRHIEWLQASLARLLAIHGSITRPTEVNPCWALNYAIAASCVLLPRLYPTEDVPKLTRKWLVWKDYANRHGHPATMADVERASSENQPSEHGSNERTSRDSRGRYRTLSRPRVF